MEINIFNKNNIDELIWPEDKDGIYAKKFLYPLVKEGTLKYIDNVDSEVQVLKFGDNILPLTVGNSRPKIKNSYVVSPTSHYLDYGKEELEIELKEKKFLKNTLGFFIDILRNIYINLSFEKVVYVNNWLLSTNLYPNFDVNVLDEVTTFLIRKFPKHVIIFRSVNDKYDHDLYFKLGRLGYSHVFSRQVYILDPSKGEYKKKDSYKKDLKIKRRTKYNWESSDSIKPEEYSRIRKLYDLLYIDKYSSLNPTFNESFIDETLKNNTLTYHALRKNGEIYGVVGFFEKNGFVTAPLFGYDTTMPLKDGLYRLTALQVLEKAIENNWILHLSSGVSKFKMHRAAKPYIEYNMVYFKHTSFKQKLAWKILEILTDLLIIPIMKKFQL